jgi:uncharacterized lipoprotein YajG
MMNPESGVRIHHSSFIIHRSKGVRMKPLVLLLATVAVLAACAAPASEPPASQPAAQTTLPEVTVFRSPT